VDAGRCIGCGGCASACPAGLIEVVDRGPLATFVWHLERCCHCGRCAEICPVQAVVMSRGFETAAGSRDDLTMSVEVYMGSCNRCGRCYSTQGPLDPPDPRPVHEARVAALCDHWEGAAP
jgi:hydrogenase-4 component H